MRFLFYFGHPAHYHMFKYTIADLKEQGYKIHILIKSKDILENLLKNENIEHINILKEGRKDSKIHILWALVKRILRISRFVFNTRPQILIGSEPSLVYVGKLFSIPSLIFVEDDANVIPHFANIAFPLATQIIAPFSCNLGKWEKKKIGYAGYQKLAYLHPNRFMPDKKKIEHLYRNGKGKFFIIRIAKLNAHHDFGIRGLNAKLVREIIDLLEVYGSVYISSEERLSPEFSSYELKLNLSDIHHGLFFAEMFIGDSQSMAVEAALLGTPSIRFNDFAGKIGILEELEHKYKLTFGLSTANPNKLIDKIRELLLMENLKYDFQIKRNLLLNDKIDTTAFYTWLIETYPFSVKKLTENSDYQYNFK